MAKRTDGAAGQQRRRRPRAAAFAVALVVVCAAVVVAIVVSSGGGGDTRAGLTPSLPRCDARAGRTALCPHNASFDARSYAVHGDAFDCISFASQADAQAVLRQDPSDPNHLDPDGHGIACPNRPGPRDTTPVKARADSFVCPPVHTRDARARALGTDMRSAQCPQAARRFVPRFYVRDGGDEYDCSQFASQADAQAVLRYMPADPNKLDTRGDGVACPDLPAPKDLKPVPTKPQS